MHPNGDEVHKVYGDGYEIVIKNKNVLIKGSCSVTINGDCNMDVKGDYNLQVSKDYTVLVGGEYSVRSVKDMKLSSSLIFYIGNGVVKASLTLYEDGKQPLIVSSRVRELPHFNERDREHLEKRILFEFGELVREFKVEDIKNLGRYKFSIDNAFVLVSSPWYISETSVVKMKEPKPFVVTESLLRNAQENIVKGYRDAHEVDISVLEQKIINIQLNGYPTNSPLKKKS